MNIKEMEKMSVDNLDFVKTQYLEHKSFIPMIIVRAMKDDKKINIVSVLSNEKLVEKRYEAIACLGIELGVRTFLKNDFDSIEAIFMLNEAWMSKFGKDKGKEIKVEDYEKDLETGKVLRPSEDPNHLEVLISAGLSSDKEAVVTIKIIKKAWKGDEVKVSFEDMDTKDPIGAKANLLEEFWKTFNVMKTYKDHVNKNEEMKKYINSKNTDELSREFQSVFREFCKNNA